jgi:tripartite-type tricarboxylate transporter receptor subunit TctC
MERAFLHQAALHMRDARRPFSAWNPALLLALSAAVVFSSAASAQYPQKVIRLIVPFVAGGTPDIVARGIEPALSDGLGQRIVIDNRAGAGGLLGTELAARAAADGYTLVIGGTSTFAITPAVHGRNSKYDAARDFSHIGMLARSRMILVGHPSFPARNVKEVIALARRNSGALNYGSSGNGTAPHMFGELFKHYAGINLQHVPYKGGPQSLTALISGEVELLVGQIPPVAPHIKSGRVRPFAVSGAARSAALPDVPTFAESGVRNLDVVVWYSLAAPAGLPEDIVARLGREVGRALGLPATRERFAAEGLEPFPTSPAEAAKFVQAEIPRWAEAVRLSGAKPD